MSNNQGFDPWYKSAGWQRRRLQQLQQFPLCAYHLQRGMLVAASVVDHVIPHRGDYNSFVLGRLQSLCKTCHDKDKRLEQESTKGNKRPGFTNRVDAKGYPIHPDHPWNQADNRDRIINKAPPYSTT